VQIHHRANECAGRPGHARSSLSAGWEVTKIFSIRSSAYEVGTPSSPLSVRSRHAVADGGVLRELGASIPSGPSQVSSPQLLCRKSRALRQRAELGPSDLRVNASAETAIS